MSAAPEVVVSDDETALAAATAQRTLDTLRAAITERGEAHLVITGGGILEQVLAALGDAGDAIDWSRVHVWWGDERYVPSDSPDRNDLPALAKLLDKVAVDPARVHRMPASDAGFGDDVDAAAAAYAADLARFADGGAGVPNFDAVLLGVGPEGHCCSLFPNLPAVYVTDASVAAVRDSPKPPPLRISLTFPALDAADEVWFVASGASKADAVRLALSGAPKEQVPAAGPRGRVHTLWLVDRAAAAASSPPA